MLLFFPQQCKCGVKRAKKLFITRKQNVCHNIDARFQWSLLASQPADANLSLHPAIKPPLPNHWHDHQWGWESMFWPLLVCRCIVRQLRQIVWKIVWGNSQRQRHDVLVAWVAIFAIVQQGDSEVVLGQICPFMTPNLSTTTTWEIFQRGVRGGGRETVCAVQTNGWRKCTLLHLVSGPVPWGVPVRGSLQVAKLDLICRVEAVHSHRKLHLQELVRLRPGHLRSRGCNAF